MPTYLGLEVAKPAKPIKRKDLYIFNKTTADQVVLNEETDERLSNSHLIKLYTHTAGKLTGSGANGRFKATVTETVSSLKVNGTVHSVNCAGETEMELVSGAWYTFILDGNTINFKGGGGLTNSKLALATATEADVLSGKTFYSGDKRLKSGEAVTSCVNTHTLDINQTYTINCGFRPEKIVVVIKYSGQTIVLEYDNNNPNVLIESTLGARVEQNNNTHSVRIKTTENGFTYWTSNYAYIGHHCTSYAMR